MTKVKHAKSVVSVLFRTLLLPFIAGMIATAELASADPWIDTRNAPLRADIEQLSRAGIISVPINTWPLMWSGILNDLERRGTVDTAGNFALQSSYARVLSAGKAAMRVDEPRQSVSLSVASESQLIRHFGDDSREEAQITLRRSSMSERFAYNLEISKTANPWDGEQTHYDNSYFGVAVGNWIAMVGNVERWWGPGWDSNLILTNNARPTPGITLQRNHSLPFELPILEHLGPWTTNMFISKLDDERHIDDANLVGMSVGFRPRQSLEINLRRSAQWGGEGRPQSFKSFLELVSGIADNCDNVLCKEDEPGNQLGGIDFRWDLPWVNASFYGQRIGEDEAGGLPSRSASQLGMQFALSNSLFQGSAFIEYDDTSTSSPEFQYNIFYNHSIYRTGYRYEGRVIGATWDNDSTVTSVGAVGYLSNGDSIEARFSTGELNVDNRPRSRHSITALSQRFSSVSAKWQRAFQWGDLKVEGRYTDRLVDDFGRQENKLRFAASVDYNF